MKNFNFLIFMLLFPSLMSAQHEKVEIGEFCYFTENQASEINMLTNEAYTYHGRIELKLGDYQITIKEGDKAIFLLILDKFESINDQATDTRPKSPTLIDNFSPELISYSKKIIDPNKVAKIYYCWELNEIKGSKGNIVIMIPELEDMFGGGTAPEKYFYLSKECVMSLRNIFR